MAASFTLKQVPLGLLRRQTPVSPITKRVYPFHSIKLYVLTLDKYRLRFNPHPNPRRLPSLPIRQLPPPPKGHPRLRNLQNPRHRTQGPST